jgi:negative regulator of flagellin synthesis FlgM
MAEINNIKPSLQPDISSNRSVGERSKTPQAATPSSNADAPSDKVSLSDTLAHLEQILASVPEVDVAKVEAVKQDIESGSYHIDNQELARKMIDFEGDL